MANDPYGFPEAVPAGDGDGSTAAWLGVLSVVAAAFGPCLCYMPYFFAFPLGLAAIYYGSGTLGSGANTSSRSSAMAGIVGGAVGAGLPILMMLFIAMYVAIIFVAGLAGAMGQ